VSNQLKSFVSPEKIDLALTIFDYKWWWTSVDFWASITGWPKKCRTHKSL